MMHKPIAFVIPWYGESLLGGAERACRELAEHLYQRGIPVEILTTCARDFYFWENFYEEGIYEVHGIKVRRFEVDPRDQFCFDRINLKILRGEPLTVDEARSFTEEMINSQNLYHYIAEHRDKYWFIFTPYLFGTTYWGSWITPENSFIIPCLHEENYLNLIGYRKALERVRRLILYAEPEKQLAERILDLKREPLVLGLGIDLRKDFDGSRFRKKFSLNEDFIFCPGRKLPEKNTPLLLEYFKKYKDRHSTPLKLVLSGGGQVVIPESLQGEVLDLGFLSETDKYDAFAAAAFTCQPSIHESFSYVIMESWVCKTPVLVHAQCAVTSDHCRRSQGGLFFKNYLEFEECVHFFLNYPEKRQRMGENGQAYVAKNFQWDQVIERFIKILISGEVEGSVGVEKKESSTTYLRG
jgi:glycosyltransferase involved in cell wall biosynthesis